MDHPLLPDDLAPGDRTTAERDWSDLSVHRVRDASDPDFELAYQQLWRVFGAGGAMETQTVIRERLSWDPTRPVGRVRLAYELLVVRRGGSLAALRDHTAVVRLDGRGRPEPGPVVVHLSHAWVEPSQRGSGLAAWLRALPLGAARRCAAAAGAAPDAPIDLVAEMEVPAHSDDPTCLPALRSYQRAGFRKVDPSAAPYRQPDFRPAEILARSAPESVPFALVVRRVGREAESSLPADELAAIVDAIYSVYAVHVPAPALDPLREAARAWTARTSSFHLLAPTA